MGECRALLGEAELVAWGMRIGGEVEVPVTIALRGDLGAGKSTLARAIARGAGVTGPVPSPTFNLLFVYDTPRDARIHHLDLYRLDDPDEVWELGWEELASGSDLVLIEWPERAERFLPRDRWELTLEEVDDPALRRVRAAAVGRPSALPAFPAAGEGEWKPSPDA